jgi:hypothetical protein
MPNIAICHGKRQISRFRTHRDKFLPLAIANFLGKCHSFNTLLQYLAIAWRLKSKFYTLSYHLKESFKDTLQNTSPAVDLSSLEDRLDKLSQEIKDSKKHPPEFPHLTNHHMVPVHKEKILNCPEKPYELYRENCLTSDKIEK